MAAMTMAGRCRSERGAELIEFAIVFPVLMLIVAGIADFGMMFRSLEVITNASREGARVGVLPAYAAADIEARVDAYMAASGLAGDDYTVTVTDETVATPAGTFTARAVNLAYTYQSVTLGPIAAFFGGTFGDVPLGARSVMRVEAPAVPPAGP